MCAIYRVYPISFPWEFLESYSALFVVVLMFNRLSLMHSDLFKRVIHHIGTNLHSPAGKLIKCQDKNRNRKIALFFYR